MASLAAARRITRSIPRQFFMASLSFSSSVQPDSACVFSTQTKQPRALDASEPVEPEVRVDAPGAFADAGHRVDDPNRFQELEILVAALPFDAQAERRAVAPRKIATVQAVGQD